MWVKGERRAGVGASLLKKEKANSKEVHRAQRLGYPGRAAWAQFQAEGQEPLGLPSKCGELFWKTCFILP